MFYMLLSITFEVFGFIFMAYSILFYEVTYWPLFGIGVVMLAIDKFFIPDKKGFLLPRNNQLPSVKNGHDHYELTMPIDEETPLNRLVKAGFHGDLVLFFGVDGVFHPQAAATVELKDKFLPLLEKFPELELIMCCDWRENSPQDWFEKRFGETLSEHFKGCTPVLESGRFRRQREIETFADTFNIKHFAVVDSRVDLYHSDFPHLIKTDIFTGITNQAIYDIESYLNNHSKLGTN